MSRINNLLLGNDIVNSINQMNILLIGVGGIGCEVLKVITKYQFKSLHILDLDTIEVSNLNRQFLFRKEHRGMYKAHVAKERILQDYPNMNIISYNDNIKDEKYGIKFFKQFQLIIMALDNTETRSFVNRIGMTLNIPLLDAGTTGYKGQAFLLKKGTTRCYDCNPKDTAQKVYPACTIRTLPEKPVHCVIWAKYLFGVLFGPSDDESNMLEDLRDQFNHDNIKQDEKENLVMKVAVELFSNSIKKQMESKEDEETSEKFKHLQPLDFEGEFKQLDHKQQVKNIDLEFLKSIHSVKDYLEIFRDSYIELLSQKEKNEFVSFEKDDPIHIKFVTSACNLRCHVFQIPLQNEFKVKQISGNIIPAIASTNSIVASIEISEAIKYIAGQVYNKPVKHKELYVQNDKINKVLSANAEKPHNNCSVCQPNLLPDIVYCDFKQTTFKQFLDTVVLSEKQLEDFSVSKEANLFYEFNDYLEDDEIEQNKQKEQKKLVDILGIGDSKFNVTNEDSGKIFRLYVLVHVEGQQQINVHKQIEGEREEVNINEIMREQGVNIKDQQDMQQEKEQLEKKCKEVNKNTFEIMDSDDDVIQEDTTNSTNVKRQLNELQIDDLGQDPKKKIKTDNTQQNTENNNNKSNQMQIEDEDDIVIL